MTGSRRLYDGREAVGSNIIEEHGDRTFTSILGHVVRYAARIYPLAKGTADESAGILLRITDNRQAIRGEITSGQTSAGAWMLVVSDGDGDVWRVEDADGNIVANLDGAGNLHVTSADFSPGGDDRLIPAGGSTGQVLAKATIADYDVEWIDPATAGVSGPTSATYTVGYSLSTPGSYGAWLRGSPIELFTNSDAAVVFQACNDAIKVAGKGGIIEYSGILKAYSALIIDAVALTIRGGGWSKEKGVADNTAPSKYVWGSVSVLAGSMVQCKARDPQFINCDFDGNNLTDYVMRVGNGDNSANRAVFVNTSCHEGRKMSLWWESADGEWIGGECRNDPGSGSDTQECAAQLDGGNLNFANTHFHGKGAAAHNGRVIRSFGANQSFAGCHVESGVGSDGQWNLEVTHQKTTWVGGKFGELENGGEVWVNGGGLSVAGVTCLPENIDTDATYTAISVTNGGTLRIASFEMFHGASENQFLYALSKENGATVTIVAAFLDSTNPDVPWDLTTGHEAPEGVSACVYSTDKGSTWTAIPITGFQTDMAVKVLTDYGAVSGHDCTAAFLAWMADVDVSGGGVGCIPPGVWKCDPDVLAITNNDVMIFGAGDASTIWAHSAGSYLLDARNGSTGVHGVKIQNLFFDGQDVVDTMFAINQATGGYTAVNEATGIKMKRYLKAGYDVGQNAVEGGLNIYGGYISGSLLAASPNAEQVGIYFRTASCQVIGTDIIGHTRAGVRAAGGCTIKPRHIFGQASTQAAAPYATCILIEGGGLYKIETQLDNCLQNAMMVVQPTAAAIDRIELDLEVIEAPQQYDHAGTPAHVSTPTYPVLYFDDSSFAIREVVGKVVGHGNTTSQWTYIADWSAAVGLYSQFDGCFVNACAAFWKNPQLDPGNNYITNSANGGTVTKSSTPSLATVAKGATVAGPTSAATYVVWRATQACTVTAVKGYVSGSTGSTINAVVRHSGSNADLLASDLALSSADTWMDGGSVQNTAMVAGDALLISIRSVSGTPSEVGVQVEFTVS